MLQDFLLTLDAGTRKAVLREMRKDLVGLDLVTDAEWSKLAESLRPCALRARRLWDVFGRLHPHDEMADWLRLCALRRRRWTQGQGLVPWLCLTPRLAKLAVLRTAR